MHFAVFSTETPLSHVPRALDEIARIGFDLRELVMRRHRDHCAVELQFLPSDKVSVECLMARLARIPGVFDLQSGPAAGAGA